MADSTTRRVEAERVLQSLEIRLEQYQLHLEEIVDQPHEGHKARAMLAAITRELALQRKYCEFSGRRMVLRNLTSDHVAQRSSRCVRRIPRRARSGRRTERRTQMRSSTILLAGLIALTLSSAQAGPASIAGGLTQLIAETNATEPIASRRCFWRAGKRICRYTRYRAYPSYTYYSQFAGSGPAIGAILGVRN
jgi:hypothetical protein